jgi:hypothetical protein
MSDLSQTISFSPQSLAARLSQVVREKEQAVQELREYEEEVEKLQAQRDNLHEHCSQLKGEKETLLCTVIVCEICPQSPAPICTAGLRSRRYLSIHAHSCMNLQSRDVPGCVKVKVFRKRQRQSYPRALERFYLTAYVSVFSRTYLHVQLEDLQRELAQRSTMGNNGVANNQSR